MKLPNCLYIRLLRRRHPDCKIHRNAVAVNVVLSDHCAINCGAQVHNSSLGRHSYINNNAIVNQCSIGAFCSIGPNCVIGLGSHPSRDYVSTSPALYHAGPYLDRNTFDNSCTTVIGNDVWIGANTTIVPGVRIGDGAIIGANTLVNKDVEPYTVVGGVPAHLIRQRFDSAAVQWLLNLKWWNQSDEWIRRHAKDFVNPEALRTSCDGK